MAPIGYGIKFLSKYGKVEYTQGRGYWINYKGYCVSFLPNGENKPENSLVCEHVQRIGESGDVQSDYFPGSFYDSLSKAIKAVERNAAYELTVA
mgnify:CR=1 FL=1